MRRDMSKVITERSRRPGFVTTGKGRLQDPDLQVSHEGMRAPHVRHWGGKELNENLAPLDRFLKSRVGQVWNDVFSEICANIRLTSTVQKHVRDHVEQMVATKIYIDDQGEPWDRDGNPHRLSDRVYPKYWVDPRDGVLKINDAKTRRQRNQDRDSKQRDDLTAHARSLPDGTELRKKNGIWYQVHLKEIAPAVRRTRVKFDGSTQTWIEDGTGYDVILETTLRRTIDNYVLGHSGSYRTSFLYCATKRQLSRVELRRYGVAND
ncbi:hypothetical protein UFOVP29_5 [uncultured Caudovirales phage]|uniref:Uncharacterized protein n=1 Tax=uncultured Caudovirales phage TaxID=2100421 RepID=A0A6J5KLM0_9CAUD|nr:hypothetical protein UFOVP29_5 [uncultured Caudovirales phage]